MTGSGTGYHVMAHSASGANAEAVYLRPSGRFSRKAVWNYAGKTTPTVKPRNCIASLRPNNELRSPVALLRRSYFPAAPPCAFNQSVKIHQRDVSCTSFPQPHVVRMVWIRPAILVQETVC